MKTKKKKIITLSIVAGAILFSALMLIGVFSSSKMVSETDFFWPDNLSAFSNLDGYVVKELSLDRQLKDLSPKEHWTKEIKIDGKQYKIYAYVFSSADEARRYLGFSKSSNLTCNYHIESGLFGSSCEVYKGSVAYRITGTGMNSFLKSVNSIMEKLRSGVTPETIRG